MIQFLEFQFCAAHFYHQPKWDEAKNRAIFGACYDTHGHGHNYRLLVGFRDLKIQQQSSLRQQIQGLISEIDHHHLNHFVPQFKSEIPTTENIARHLGDEIKKKIQNVKLARLKLFEMDDLWAEVHYE